MIFILSSTPPSPEKNKTSDQYQLFVVEKPVTQTV